MNYFKISEVMQAITSGSGDATEFTVKLNQATTLEDIEALQNDRARIISKITTNIDMLIAIRQLEIIAEQEPESQDD